MQTKTGRAPGRRDHLMVSLSVAAAISMHWAAGASAAASVKFEISFPRSLHAQPVTGRVFLVISKENSPDPRLQAGFWGDTAPVFGMDVNDLGPGQVAVVDGGTLGYPTRSLNEIPAADYYIQAVLNVYTQFHRGDGRIIWAHMDRWEGQQWNRSPGNFYSEVKQVHLDSSTGYDLKLRLTRIIPPVEVPRDTEWVVRVKIQSGLLTKFWGRPVFLGATVLLPRNYRTDESLRYPVLYLQDHFSLEPPFGFATEPGAHGDYWRGHEFYQSWNSENFPRLIVATFQHPTPYFDDSYAVNSANNGPYGDAIMTELIPYLEQRFRIIREPYARVLAGGSTGGWESLALQVYHPEVFGGTWSFFPDPVDFRRYDLVNIYDDDNAFVEPRHTWLLPERYIMRQDDGQPEVTVRQFSQLEEVLGSKGRSGQQLEVWEAVYGPVGDDGYPKPLWNKRTGKIDHEVAAHMRDHGYDLRYYIQDNWARIGPGLTGKLHIYCGDMDNYYLNLAVYLLEDFLKNTTDPFYAGSFEYGRPMKGHGWHPMSWPDLIRMMADHITRNAPSGEHPESWNH